ncbi:MAG: ArsR family transcriptional regulator [Methanotrichaceae archaeon]|nr:ArsR family transcriptional regulator [Methanotrichaceae archaeon]
MKESSVLRFDERDLEVVETLRNLGVPRKVSSMLAFLANVDEATSRDIERASDLRQPEVSIALRTLRRNRWVKERICKSNGSGRPTKVYRLAQPIEQILEHYEEEKLREANKAMENIQKLRGLLAHAESI